LEYTNKCDEIASTHVMIGVMICLENEIKGEGRKSLPGSRYTDPNPGRVEWIL
jgi:hypothetical protein